VSGVTDIRCLDILLFSSSGEDGDEDEDEDDGNGFDHETSLHLK
jgi:hypothetical protein